MKKTKQTQYNSTGNLVKRQPSVLEAHHSDNTILYSSQLSENSLRRRIVNKPANMAWCEAIGYAQFYQSIMPSEKDGIIDVHLVKSFLGKTIKHQNPDIYAKILYNYGIERNSDLAKVPHSKLVDEIIAYFEESRINSIHNALMFSATFKEFAGQIAEYLDAPEEMSVETRIKWLRMWFLLFYNSNYFVVDGLHDPTISAQFDKLYFGPDKFMLFSQQYFRKINERIEVTGERTHVQDGRIIYSILKEAVKLFCNGDSAIEETIYQFSELKKPYRRMSNGEVRKQIKEKLFPSSTYLSLSQFMSRAYLKDSIVFLFIAPAVKAYRNGGIANLLEMNYEYPDPNKSFDTTHVTHYKITALEIDGVEYQVGVSSDAELSLYNLLWNWVLVHPEVDYGDADIEAIKRELDDSVVESPVSSEPAPQDFQEFINDWILDMGLASDTADINVELTHQILHRDAFKYIFIQYNSGALSANDIYRSIEFPDRALALVLCSHSGLKFFDKNKFKQALNRVNDLGIDSVSAGDWLYYQTAMYLKKVNPLCGKDSRPFKSYKLNHLIK